MADTTQEKWIKNYTSSLKILLVGEGDFSFAACLAKAFGSPANMVATSLDSKESLRVNYSMAMGNLKELEVRSGLIFHEVDAHTMSQNHLLLNKLFDRIVFNFPYAGLINLEHRSSQIELHKALVRGFFKSAREILSRGGEVHLRHKTTYPFSEWKIVELAAEFGLYLVEEERQSSPVDYPG